MKSFTSTPPGDEDEDRPYVEFEFDKKMLTARKPKTAAFIALIDTDDTDGADNARSVMRFVRDALIPESRAYITRRLEDPDDELDVGALVPVVNWVIEEFTSERPTGPSNGSSPPPGSTGSGSTEPSPSRARTRSTSKSTASSTP